MSIKKTSKAKATATDEKDTRVKLELAQGKVYTLLVSGKMLTFEKGHIYHVPADTAALLLERRHADGKRVFRKWRKPETSIKRPSTQRDRMTKEGVHPVTGLEGLSESVEDITEPPAVVAPEEFETPDVADEVSDETDDDDEGQEI